MVEVEVVEEEEEEEEEEVEEEEEEQLSACLIRVSDPEPSDRTLKNTADRTGWFCVMTSYLQPLVQ